MLQKFIVSVLLILTSYSLSQSEFSLNSFLGRSERVVLNGDTLSIDSSQAKVQTYYPIFDTLIILSQMHENETRILCNFRPDSSYSLFYACCGSVDIYPTWKVNKVIQEGMQYDERRYQELMIDYPLFTLRVVNNIQRDSIFGWYVDHACSPSFKLLTEEWEYGSPVKCYYWNNISTFDFFTSSETYADFMDNGTQVVRDVFPYPNYDESSVIDRLASVLVRLFDSESYIISFDAQTSEVKLERTE